MIICTVADCGREKSSKIGYCAFHLYRLKNNIPFDKPIKVKYKNEEEKREGRLKSCKKYYQQNKEKLLNVAKDYYYENQEQILEYKKSYREENRDVINQKVAQWRKDNPEQVKRLNREYYNNNYEKFINYTYKREFQLRNAFIDISFFPEIEKIYRNCPEGYQVDHIIPLQGENVSGLHVPWNLQHLSEKENNFKRNKFDFTYKNESWRKNFDNK